jgi:DNA-binding NtrC family response regulator
MGLFEEANGGILFLDEIGDVPPAVQNKLLRAIEEKQIKRLGTNHHLLCDVQIIAATSRNLSEMIQQGEFREDLYCRLAVLTLQTTPLRERREDIPAMVALFLREAADASPEPARQDEPYQIEEGALAHLCEFEYPGNIRALRNLIYELTSYVEGDEPISIQLVQFALAKQNFRMGKYVTGTTNDWPDDDLVASSGTASSARTMSPTTLHAILRSMAREGDIILPLELCVLRRGETFKQWTARAKRSSIEAARQATGGTMRSVAERLGLTRNSLMGHLNRAKQAQNEVLFDWKRKRD